MNGRIRLTAWLGVKGCVQTVFNCTTPPRWDARSTVLSGLCRLGEADDGIRLNGREHMQNFGGVRLRKFLQPALQFGLLERELDKKRATESEISYFA